MTQFFPDDADSCDDPYTYAQTPRGRLRSLHYLEQASETLEEEVHRLLLESQAYLRLSLRGRHVRFAQATLQMIRALHEQLFTLSRQTDERMLHLLLQMTDEQSSGRSSQQQGPSCSLVPLPASPASVLAEGDALLAALPFSAAGQQWGAEESLSASTASTASTARPCLDIQEEQVSE